MLTTWFIPKCTINLMFWKHGISYKMCSQNAANAISGIQILKFFWWWGGAPPPPKNFFAKFLPLVLVLVLYWYQYIYPIEISIHVTGMLHSDKLPIFFLIFKSWFTDWVLCACMKRLGLAFKFGFKFQVGGSIPVTVY